MFKLLAARVIVFFVAIVWVAGWVFMGLIFWDSWLDQIYGLQPDWLPVLLQVWYIATIVVIGAWVALKGFRFVGKWETQ